jgi:PrgI family protein
VTRAEHDAARDRGRVRIPADVEREDRLLANLTARQLAILAVAGVVLWAGYSAMRHIVAPAIFGVVAVPFGAGALLLALGSFEGVAADRWVRAAWSHHRAPHRLVPAPDGVATAPAFAGIAGPLPSPLRLPLVGIRADGIVDLGVDGLALVCGARAVTFSLRTFTEQEALVAGFARFLNSLAEPVEILVRAEPADLAPIIDALLGAAPELPHPALEAAARGHAHFLSELAGHRDLLRREVLIVLRQASGDDASGRLHRRASEAAAALGAAGVSLVVLDGPAAARCLARALDLAGGVRVAGVVGTEEPITMVRVTKDDVA